LGKIFEETMKISTSPPLVPLNPLRVGQDYATERGRLKMGLGKTLFYLSLLKGKEELQAGFPIGSGMTRNKDAVN
jgi:hypothetical protein